MVASICIQGTVQGLSFIVLSHCPRLPEKVSSESMPSWSLLADFPPCCRATGFPYRDSRTSQAPVKFHVVFVKTFKR